MSHHLIPLEESQRWNAALADVPHAYGHTWRNCRAMSLSTRQATFLYVFERHERKVVCPVAERRYGKHVDIVTPYGFSGFSGNGPCPEVVQDWNAFVNQRGYVCGYIGLNPLICDETHIDMSTLHSYNSIYVLDLRLELEELVARMSNLRRRQIRAAKEMANIVVDQDRLVSFLLDHYQEFYLRKGAAQVYEFARVTMSELAECEHTILIGTEGAGGIDSVMMFAFTPHVADYFLNVSLPEGQRNSVALLWFGIKELKARGIPWLNLGGGITPGDGVAEFKRKFGGAVLPLTCLKQVYDRDVYRSLCLARNLDPEDRDAFFPPFHR